MLDLNKCQLIETRTENLLSTVVALDEGVPMVHVLENGVAAAKPATGDASEQFIGVSVGRSQTPTIVPRIETRTVPASSPYTITLEKPISGGIGIVSITNGVRTVQNAGTPGSNANEYSISGNVVTFHSGQAGKTVELTYFYPITFQEAMVRFKFDAFTPSTAPLPTIGLIATGEIFTSNFDPSSNWAGWTPGTPIKLGNGMFTLSGNGPTISALVSALPGVDSPFLGLRLNAGN